MDRPKYIIVLSHDVECAVVFNPILSHAEVAGTMNVIAAGECKMPDEHNSHVSAWGGSHTLKIESRGDIDTEVIKRGICED